MTATFAAPRPARSDWVLLTIYWLVVSPILLVQYRADTAWPLGRLVTIVGATMVLDTTAVALLVGGLLPLFLNRRYGWGLALLPLFLALSGTAYVSLYHRLLSHTAAFTVTRLVLGVVAHAKSYGLLAVLLTGKRYFEAQHRVLQLQKAQAEGELRALRAQLDPHFLFNNLHVLQVLIGQDTAVAEQFLHRFAGLYRYLLRHREADFVTLAEELEFLDEYVYLLRHRFGDAYEFHTTLAPELDPNQLQVVPGTLQLLLENAIKHNRGDEDEPLAIAVVADATGLLVRNPRRPKRTPADSAGLGLPNLQQRYRLLAGEAVQVVSDAHFFQVRVPLLRHVPAPAVVFSSMTVA
jgi:two-component system LytT family sensor kinase